jgi:DNA replication protein DnaC
MQVAPRYSESLTNNIERTYTYAHVKNVHGLEVEPHNYNAIETFNQLVARDPFGTFMELDSYGFKNTLRALVRYDIPYTAEQERKARVYFEVTQDMENNRSDVSIGYQDDIAGTGIVKVDDPHIYTTETTIKAKRFIESLPRNKKSFNYIYEDKVPKALLDSAEQYEALKNSVTNHVSCLIGGAGTGKSFVTSEIVEQLMLNGKRVTVLAPTHKAKEALQSKLKRGTVQTIHSFVYGRSGETDVIVIDEAGMIPTELMSKLAGVYNNEQLVFVGDKNQIPPIGYGRPFEVIQEIFPTVELKANRRSEAKDIIALGREIINEPFNANIAQNNIYLVDTVEEAFKLGAEVLLTFTRDGVKKANEIQRIKGEPAIDKGFSIGDKIIAKTNTKRFFNGQLFTIITWNKATDGQGNTVTFRTPYELSNNFDLAYGLTIHKSQGSEWDVVAYQPTDKDTKNLAYVAVTRAKKKLIIVGGFPPRFKEETSWIHL